MSSEAAIEIIPRGDGNLSGLGMMIGQYLEQNLAEFDYKVRQGLGLRGRVSVTVEKGIAVTVTFDGSRIYLEDGIQGRSDLHLMGSFVVLAGILSGQADPLREVARGRIKLGGIPRRPLMALKILRFLKVPEELLVEGRSRPGINRWVLAAASLAGLSGLAYLLYLYL